MKDIFHIEIKSGKDVFQFVSGPIEWEVMFKWLYKTMEGHPSYKAIIYTATQNVGDSFKLFNEVGRVRFNNGLKYYRNLKKEGDSALYITPKGKLVSKKPIARRA